MVHVLPDTMVGIACHLSIVWIVATISARPKPMLAAPLMALLVALRPSKVPATALNASRS
ncbi:MAG: hypothetical protein PUP92_34510 [Rhizonema sp. PD38]|nr:hypothetical protein [Rhizonema sp. PD38]